MQKNTILILISFSLLLISGYLIFNFIQGKKDTTKNLNKVSNVLDREEDGDDDNLQKESTKNSPQKIYSLEDISKHSKRDDCWFAINGEVYDVTSFISSGKHPGGEAIVQGCGKDATKLFEARPMGSGTPHSEDARENLRKFRIGKLMDGSN